MGWFKLAGVAGRAVVVNAVVAVENRVVVGITSWFDQFDVYLSITSRMSKLRPDCRYLIVLRGNGVSTSAAW